MRFIGSSDDSDHDFMLLKKTQKSKSKTDLSEDSRDSHIVGLKITTLDGNAFAALKSLLLLPASLKYSSEGEHHS